MWQHLKIYDQVQLASTFRDVAGTRYSLAIVAGARLTGELAFCVLVGSWRARHALLVFSAIEGARAAGN